MTGATLDPVAVACFVAAAFALAGLCQAAWLASPWRRDLAVPLDGGATFRGRRVLGDHKTVRGCLVMVPATGLAFAGLHEAVGTPATIGLWPGSAGTYLAWGLAAGVGFMAGELPNSFVKRQLGIAPGAAGSGGLRWVFLAADRLDSVAGALVALATCAGVPAVTWLLLGVGGPLLHGAFSALTWQLGGKARMA
ncbi:MAG: CDP-archaeol synthase [Vicinamibacterales bacterium]